MSPEVHRIDALRCADQDRELVAQVLNNAYAEGRLTFDEHAERIAQAYDAKTFGDLDHLTTDLVARPRQVAAPAPSFATVAPQTTSVVPAGAFTGGNGVMSTYRPGRIDVFAPEATINAWLSEARIDLVETTFAARETTINLGGLMCDIRIRVPEGVDVNASGLSMVMGETRIDGTVPRPDGIRINLVGSIFLGEVTVLGPDTKRRAKYEKFVK